MHEMSRLNFDMLERGLHEAAGIYRGFAGNASVLEARDTEYRNLDVPLGLFWVHEAPDRRNKWPKHTPVVVERGR